MNHIKEEYGQSLILIAFGIITLFAFAGLAVDLGIAYVERVRVRKAADAAALAAASELPLEGASHLRALEFLEDNGYGCGLTESGGHYSCAWTDRVRTEVNGTYISGPAPSDADWVISLNTSDYRNEGEANTASKIRVEVQAKAPIYFLRVFDFFEIPVMGRAVAENVNNIDVAIIFDRSGSMEFDTLCYGCWTKNGEYPNGTVHPLYWGPDPDGPATQCTGNEPLEYDDQTYYIIEAEEYSATNVPYNRENYSFGKTYWVVQRTGHQAEWYMRHGNGSDAYGRDTIGAYIQHMPARQSIGPGNDGPGVSCRWEDVTGSERLCRTIGRYSSDPFPFGDPFPAPRVDYEFEIDSIEEGEVEDWYIWIRAQASNQGNHVFWGLDGDVLGRREMSYRDGGNYYDGAEYNDWAWRRLGFGKNPDQQPGDDGNEDDDTVQLSHGPHTLHLWAGDPNFAVDRIIITDNPTNPGKYYDDNDNGYYGENDIDPPNTYNDIVNNVMESNHFDNNRTGTACNPCDPRFGGSPASDPMRAAQGLSTPYCEASDFPQPYRYLDDIYDDEQPIRASIEAAKSFVRMMDFKFDQVGLVQYSGSAQIKSELQCLRELGDSCTPAVVTDTVIARLDNLNAGGSTNIGDGINKGIQVLSTQPGHYGRPGAAHIMVLMTDGQANTSYSSCLSHLDSGDPDTWLWPDHDDASNYWKGKECAMHEALRARDNGIVIYTITLGNNADIELMEEIADTTGGVHRNAPRPEQLEPIFAELYKRIFLRLVE